MEKPITITIEEFKKQLTDAINNSGLHPFILDSIFKDFYNEIRVLYQNQALQDKQKYEEMLKEESDKKNKN